MTDVVLDPVIDEFSGVPVNVGQSNIVRTDDGFLKIPKSFVDVICR